MFFDGFFSALAASHCEHRHESGLYAMLKGMCKSYVQESGLSRSEPTTVSFGEFGDLCFPYTSFGSISSLDLFGLDELIMFSFYLRNRDKYRKVLDIGGNIGLHSIMMKKLGWDVTAYEPDPLHCQLFERNIGLNRLNNVRLCQNAVFDRESNMTFIRVEGNTTGSHIRGLKPDPYGDLFEFDVKSLDILGELEGVDFIKLDAEGAEHVILTRIPVERFESLDVMAEVSTKETAKKLFDHFSTIDFVNIYSQKNDWRKISSIDDLPSSHREGSVFISNKGSVPF